MTNQPTIRFLKVITTVLYLFLNNPLYGEAAFEVQSEQLCVIPDDRITESSGLAFSKRQPGTVWIHNDSGDVAKFFLVGLDGATRGVFHLENVPMPVDWEDMCGFTIASVPWLMIGDVGDNSTSRHIVTPDLGMERACRLFLFHEPGLNDGAEPISVPVHTTIVFEYEDGPRNCESVAVDTDRREIILVSKSKSTPLDCGMYSIPLTLEAGTTVATARRIGSLDIHNATAMDIAPDNHRMVIIAFEGAYVVDRAKDEGWGDAIKRKLPFFKLPKRNGGETVCFGQSRDELLLNSEHVGQPLWRVQIPALAAIVR